MPRKPKPKIDVDLSKTPPTLLKLIEDHGPKKGNVIYQLARGATQLRAAQVAGVSKDSVTRWMKDPKFVDALEAERSGRFVLTEELLEQLAFNKEKSGILALFNLRDTLKPEANIRYKMQEQKQMFERELLELKAAQVKAMLAEIPNIQFEVNTESLELSTILKGAIDSDETDSPDDDPTKH